MNTPVTAPRIPPVPPADWPPPLHAVLEASKKDGPGRVNLFGTLAHHPALASAWLALAKVLTHEGTLAVRDRELAVLRTAHRLGSAFVWSRHASQATTAGLDAEEARATAEPLDAYAWGTGDLDLLRATDALLDHADVPDDVWSALSHRLREQQLIELLVLVGQCSMMCMTLRTLRTPSDATGPQVSISRERCCSSGQCVATAPDVFEQSDEDGLVTLLVDAPGPELAADLRLAAALCPGGAITVTE
ncbi:carboxymuconolactone decarboxylase family protein [Streptomyces sp. NBC_01465]|uniref:carboxymuconolactone decarboxylase family protein n=1 Tax=Streptomyces sp. NBC_01465 TaxID=2903878 RepID=UPI002E344BC4|nr:ferredoxin [Streptomyces sp. NBC_01465]